jgi:hypothetical protein
VSTTEEDARIKDETIARGRKVYEEQLRSRLEPEHTGHFVAIEPESGRYFLSDTGTGALIEALAAMPDSLFYLARVGYSTADSFGGHASRIE